VTTLDRARYPELQRLVDHVEQAPGSEDAVLYVAPA
jgi:hypothetical protein